MSEWRQRAIEGLKAGDRFSFSRTFEREDTERFGDLTRDYNPVHYEPRFAASKGFPELICHGLLVGGMLCQIGGQLAWLATRMDFRFKRPVPFGDTIRCTVTVTSVAEDGRATADVVFDNQDGVVVATAALGGLAPGPADREVLAAMVAEGDPTNPLGR